LDEEEAGCGCFLYFGDVVDAEEEIEVEEEAVGSGGGFE
jgi:hypothetical protein